MSNAANSIMTRTYPYSEMCNIESIALKDLILGREYIISTYDYDKLNNEKHVVWLIGTLDTFEMGLFQSNIYRNIKTRFHKKTKNDNGSDIRGDTPPSFIKEDPRSFNGGNEEKIEYLKIGNMTFTERMTPVPENPYAYDLAKRCYFFVTFVNVKKIDTKKICDSFVFKTTDWVSTRDNITYKGFYIAIKNNKFIDDNDNVNPDDNSNEYPDDEYKFYVAKNTTSPGMINYALNNTEGNTGLYLPQDVRGNIGEYGGKPKKSKKNKKSKKSKKSKKNKKISNNYNLQIQTNLKTN